jgi:CBS domain containing-hemolysin-like protein
METTPLDTALRLVAVLALVFANGFFVAAEFALVTVRKTRVDQLIAEGHRRARTVRRALTDPESYIAATQLGITMASLALGWIGEPALAHLIEPIFARFLPPEGAAITSHTLAIAIAFAIITALHIVLGELAPKTIALQHPEHTSLWVAKPTELFMRTFWPFIVLLNGMGRAAVNAMGLRPPSGHSLVHSEEELKMLVTASQEAGVLEEQEEQMLHRVFGFGDLTAGQVMLPRTEMVSLAEDATLAEVIAAVANVPHTRFPVYRENADDVLGVVHIKDLFNAATARGERLNLATLAREALTVPETMKADDLLAEMQRRRTHHAIVIDEYGGTAGMVTFEGLMARIVGEVGEAPDVATPRIVTLADGSALLDGLTLVRDVNEQFGLNIDEDVYTTIGGYVLGRLGRRPRLGDRIEVETRTLRVEALDGLRVARVFVTRPPHSAGAQDGEKG